MSPNIVEGVVEGEFGSPRGSDGIEVINAGVGESGGDGGDGAVGGESGGCGGEIGEGSESDSSAVESSSEEENQDSVAQVLPRPGSARSTLISSAMPSSHQRATRLAHMRSQLAASSPPPSPPAGGPLSTTSILTPHSFFTRASVLSMLND